MAKFSAVKSDKVDPYEDYPIDEDRETEKPEVALKIAKDVREYGNKLFKEGKTEEALQKYQSGLSLQSLSTSLNLIHYPISESIRYLDLHPVLPENSPPELQDGFNALLAPLLLNSALAAIRAQPQSSSNAVIAIANATRALDKLQLSKADKGTCSLSTIVIYDRYSLYHFHFTSESVVPSCSCSCIPEDRREC